MLSVIIPVFNSEHYIERCLNSVLANSNIEVICVDDGSTDNSLRVLRSYEKKYDNLIVIHQNNQYAGIARSNGLSIAKGEYVHFLDSDDIAIADNYERMYKLADENDLDYVKAYAIPFDMQTDEILTNPYYDMSGIENNIFGRVFESDDSVEPFLQTSCAPWMGLYKRRFLIENHILFNDFWCVNDRTFYMQVIGKSEKKMFIKDYIVKHQVNNENSLAGSRRRVDRFHWHIKSTLIMPTLIENINELNKERILRHEITDFLVDYSKTSKQCQEEYGKQIKKEIIPLYMEYMTDQCNEIVNKCLK